MSCLAHGAQCSLQREMTPASTDIMYSAIVFHTGLSPPFKYQGMSHEFASTIASSSKPGRDVVHLTAEHNTAAKGCATTNMYPSWKVTLGSLLRTPRLMAYQRGRGLHQVTQPRQFFGVRQSELSAFALIAL